MKLKIFFLFCFSTFSLTVFSQRGKDLSYTVTAANTQMNAYTSLTADAGVGNTSLSVTSNTLNGGMFSGNLAAGDLLLIIQMQGASIDVDYTYAVSNGFTSAAGHSFDWWLFKSLWGQVLPGAYNNAGKYEFVEVQSIGAGTINIQCGLKNNYTATGKVQVIRVPRVQNLTLNANTSVIPQAWNGTTGGVVALEVNGNLTFNNNSKISASALGFRGGALSAGGGAIAGSNPNFDNYTGSPNITQGAEKGEGIGGFTTEYNAMYSRYGNGAPGNAGGGGGNQNAGGGGGANVSGSAVTYTGTGVPDPNPSYAAAWNLESAGFATSFSPGGGRGGYTYSQSGQNPLTLGPNQNGWSVDYRRKEGGFGGHNLAYDPSRAFMGGGGGAGHQNQSQGGAGGKGGGIVFLTAYGTITGATNALIEADGESGGSANPTNAAATIGQKRGNDGAGGAGGGGAVIISNGTAIPAAVSVSAKGGNGGNQNLTLGQFASNEADGPGGGGAGGMIAFTSGIPVQSVTGGTAGVTTSTQMTAFPPNGATGGAPGMSSLTNPFFDLNVSNQTICSGNSVTLTATVVGTLPAGSQINWYSSYSATAPMAGGSNTATFTTPVLTGTVTYYVGICGSGTFRKPVTVTVGGPAISGTAVVTDVTCSTSGSITGLTTSGGVAPVTITWNSVVTPGMDLTNASAGTYNVLVTDNAGCTATSGPYTIASSGGPTVNTTNMVVTNQNCLGANGAISGITTTGTIVSVSWNSGTYNTLDISSLPGGNYSLVVTDNLGCTATAGPINVGVTPGPSIDQTNVLINNATCGLSNGTISGIVATGNALTFEWNSVPAVDEDVTGLAAGSYTLVAEDNLGCTASAGPFVVANEAGPALNTSGISIVDDHCSQSIGSITGITVTGGTAPVNISWNSGAYSTLDITSINAGNYTLTVTDNNGCTATTGPHNVANIAGPAVNTTNMVIDNETCAGNDGAITGITATGTGTLSYQWNLTAPAASPDLTGVTAGSYVLIVRDLFGCQTISGPFTISGATPPAINTTNIDINPETCSADNGSITGITTTGNIVSVSWNAGAYNTLDINGLNTGSYSLVVTDNNGCTASAGPFVVADETGPVLDASAVQITDDHCSQSQGSITGITVSGGTGTVDLSWSPGSETTLDINSLNAGNYTLTATDVNGCTATSGPHSVSNIAGPVINTTGMDINAETCAGNDGSITGITATGAGTLTYQWNSLPVASSAALNGVQAGNYTLIVEDAFGCQATSGPHVISGATPMSLDITNVVVTNTGCTSNTGSITGIQVVGGINPQIMWSNNAATSSISNLAAGNYVITVTDDQGCTVTEDFDVNTLNSPFIDVFGLTVTAEHCGMEDGTVSGLVASGGTAPYGYSWNTVPAVSTINLLNAGAGSYTLTVTDAAGCTATADVTVASAAGPIIDLSALLVTSSTCNEANGSASGILYNGSGPLSYQWNYEAQTAPDLVNAPGGTYSVVVTDAFGCTATAAVTIQNAGEVIADFSYLPVDPSPGDIVSFMDNSTGSIIADWNWSIDTIAIAGTGSSVDYAFVNEGAYEVTLTVTGDQGCIDSITKIVNVTGEIFIPNVITRNNDGLNDVFLIKNLQAGSELVILNRWGSTVFIASEYKNDWQGLNMAGEELSEGVYTYQLINAEGKLWQGFVHLIID